jgi:hypothetical protein
MGSNELAIHLLEGKIIEQNPVEAGRFFARGCDQGSVNACCNLATLSIKHDLGNPDDVAQAISHLEGFEPDAVARDPFCIGLAYSTGLGRSVDKNKALGFFHESCDAGLLDGCVRVAQMRMVGEGVPVDLTEAAMALEKGSAAGDPMSSLNLAELIYRGEGVPRDESRAITLYQKACAEGLPMACSRLEAIGQ